MGGGDGARTWVRTADLGICGSQWTLLSSCDGSCLSRSVGGDEMRRRALTVLASVCLVAPAGARMVVTDGALPPVADPSRCSIGLGCGPDGILDGADFQGQMDDGDARGTRGVVSRIHRRDGAGDSHRFQRWPIHPRRCASAGWRTGESGTDDRRSRAALARAPRARPAPSHGPLEAPSRVRRAGGPHTEGGTSSS